jgi:riboflavin kinase/FMN adenylyltransferase
MRVIRGLDQYPADAPPCVVALGTFDGVHLGHQAVIRTAVDRARALSLRSVAVTFDPNPMTVLRPAEAPPEIVSLDERLARIADLGSDLGLVIPFTPEFSRVEAETFVQDVLLGRLRAREVVVGFNHTFGRGARGTPFLLAEVAASAAARVHVIQPLMIRSVVVSSSSIREALRRGDVELAGRLLGRPYAVRGIVGRGEQRGRILGFPTANLVAPPGWLLADGVYAGRAGWAGRSAPAVVNVGMRPTFDERTRLIEAHVLDATPELYGEALTVAFLSWLREERRFPSVEALRAQIEADVALARRVLAEPTR